MTRKATVIFVLQKMAGLYSITEIICLFGGKSTEIIRTKAYMFTKVNNLSRICRWIFTILIQIFFVKLFWELYVVVFIFSITVWGNFNDVTASDFFRVQIDTDYRKEWDPNSIELKVIDSDPSSNSDILYWEFLFPVCELIIFRRNFAELKDYI